LVLAAGGQDALRLGEDGVVDDGWVERVAVMPRKVSSAR
jgi:hypothetical protein